MKKIVAICLILALTMLLAACGDAPTNVGTDDPNATGTIDPSATPSGSITPSGSGGITPTPSGSATPTGTGLTPTPSGTGTTGTPGGPTHSPTILTPTGGAEEVLSGFSNVYKAFDTVLLVKVTKDLGVENVWATAFGSSYSHVYIGHWVYEVEVVTAYKSPSSNKVKAKDTIKYSQPYEYNMDTRKGNTVTREAMYVPLEVGKSYLLFADYDGDYKLFSCGENASEPNKFLYENDLLFIKTGDKNLPDAWEAGKGKTGISLKTFENAAK